MGREAERIGVACALEAHSLKLRQAFDVGAAERKSADAFDEVDEGASARRAVERLLAQREAELCDLVGAGADGEAEAGLVVDEGGFEGDAGYGVGCEFIAGVVIEDDVEHHAHTVAQRCDALAHGVQWEKVAQDDPEPFHALSIASGFCPADSARRYPTNPQAWRLKSRGNFFGFPTDWRRLFPRFWAAVSTASSFDGRRFAAAQDEAFPFAGAKRLILSLPKDEPREARRMEGSVGVSQGSQPACGTWTSGGGW